MTAIGKGKPGPGRPKGKPNKPTLLSYVYNALIGTFKADMFYVYAHYDMDECIYIGKGKGGRAWEASQWCRNEMWWHRAQAAQRQGTFDVRIIAAQLTEEEAFSVEREIIRSRRPSCNVVTFRE